MKKYTITAQRGQVQGHFICRGEDPLSAMADFQERNPSCRVIDIQEVSDSPKKPSRSPAQYRANHKARITQVRNNISSLLEGEENILTMEERVQLSRITCKIGRVLALWSARSLDLKLNGEL